MKFYKSTPEPSEHKPWKAIWVGILEDPIYPDGVSYTFLLWPIPLPKDPNPKCYFKYKDSVTYFKHYHSHWEPMKWWEIMYWFYQYGLQKIWYKLVH